MSAEVYSAAGAAALVILAGVLGIKLALDESSIRRRQLASRKN